MAAKPSVQKRLSKLQADHNKLQAKYDETCRRCYHWKDRWSHADKRLKELREQHDATSTAAAAAPEDHGVSTSTAEAEAAKDMEINMSSDGAQATAATQQGSFPFAWFWLVMLCLAWTMGAPLIIPWLVMLCLAWTMGGSAYTVEADAADEPVAPLWFDLALTLSVLGLAFYLAFVMVTTFWHWARERVIEHC